MKENIYPFKGRNGSVEQKQGLHKILAVEDISSSTYILRFERLGLEFKAGQYISVGLPGKAELREYSIYSAVDDPYLEILIREVEDGSVSRKLRKLKAGEAIEVDGPFGFFTLPENYADQKFLFIASGTGISPFHSIVRSQPDLNYSILHGVRQANEGYGKSAFSTGNHTLCTSKESKGDFEGRVTEWLKQNPIDPDTKCYLCGNCDMIYDCFDILEEQGVAAENLHAEVYF